MTGAAYTARQRRELEDALNKGEAAFCPVCLIVVNTRPVDPPTTVSYVRHRVWVICPLCKRSASLDLARKD